MDCIIVYSQSYRYTENNRLCFAGCCYGDCKRVNRWKYYLTGAITKEEAAWLEETERRCPVTDNIKADTTVNVSLD